MKMNKILIYMIGILALVGVVNGIDLSECQHENYLTSNGSTYNLINNISGSTSPWACLTFQGENMTLDCHGYWFINETPSSPPWGFDRSFIFYSGERNITIKNCNFKAFNGSTIAILGYDTGYNINLSNLTFYNNFANIWIDGHINTTINNILMYNTTYTGIRLAATNQNINITNVTVQYGSTWSIYIQNTHNLLMRNIIMKNADPYVKINLGTGVGIGFLSADDFSLRNINIQDYEWGVVYYSENNQIDFRDSIINNSNKIDITFRTYSYLPGYTRNNTLINVTFNTLNNTGYYSQIEKRWYYKLYVNNSIGLPLSNARVYITDQYDNLLPVLFTDATGWVNTTLKEYSINDNVTTYYSNYTVRVEHNLYNTSTPTSIEFNLTDNILNHSFEFDIRKYIRYRRPKSTKFFSEGTTNNFTIRPISTRYYNEGTTNNFTIRTFKQTY